jgi:hypothetical protein
MGVERARGLDMKEVGHEAARDKPIYGSGPQGNLGRRVKFPHPLVTPVIDGQTGDSLRGVPEIRRGYGNSSAESED